MLYNRVVKWIAIALTALVLSGCAKSIDNQEAAQKAVDQYFTSKPGLRGMSARVQSVIFRGNEADATVMVTGKGADPSTAIPIPYILERKSSEWAVKGPSKNAMAAHSSQNGGQMPAEHPDMGAAPGAQPDGSQKMNMPPDHPPIGSSK